MTRTILFALLLALLLAMLTVSCAAPPAQAPGNDRSRESGGTVLSANASSPDGNASHRTDAAAPRVRRFTAGRSVEDRPIPGIEIGRGPVTTLFIASIHGNEPAGTPLLEQLAEHLMGRADLMEGRRVVILPEANPDGLARNTRHNVNGVDLNRNFESSNRTNSRRYGMSALSEPEAAAIDTMIRLFAPVAIVTLHQPIACVDYDGPARELAEEISALCGLPIRKLGTRPGSLGSFAGVERGIPIVTVELPRDASRQTAAGLWEDYGPSLLAVIEWDRP